MTGRIGLTFDDGPSDWTEPILDILAAQACRATFFVIGNVAERRAEVLHRIVAEGHEVGNHTWSHPRLARDCDDERVQLELRRTNEVLEGILGSRVRRFRAPYYDVDERVKAIAATLGLEHTPGTVRPPDWVPNPRSNLIATLALQQVGPDCIVGLHDGIPPEEADAPGASRQATVDAVAVIVPRLRERGYECVTASMLLDGAEPPAATGRRPVEP
jgi:peptidoglycan/xylan/chitin deacetylase (PgdA/CDA1 family)